MQRRNLSVALSTLLIAVGFSAISDSSARAAVVSSGLVIQLDAGNTSSYPGSGSTWTDLSGNGLNATLSGLSSNLPSYSSSNGGVLNFDNTNYQIATIGNISTSFASGFSATFYANFGSTVNNWERILDIGNGDAASNILIARSGSSDDFWFETYANPSSAGLHNGASQGYCKVTNGLTGGGFHHWTITFTSGTCAIYKDGISQTVVNTFAANTNIPVATRTTNYIGRSNWAADSYFEGSVGDIAIYNRALTSSEIYQNYSNQIPPCTATPTYSGNNGYVTFQTQGTCGWTVPYGANTYNYLIVGGGGGGGGGYNGSWNGGGGGGGAGEVFTGSSTFTSGDVHAITIGAGGSGGAGSTSPASGGTGETTTVLTLSKNARPGLGGAPGTNSANCSTMSGAGGASGNGNAGGTPNCDGAGSGAGSSAVGGPGYDIGSNGGCSSPGGAGTNSSITGTNTTYAAGGGGGGGASSANTNGNLANCPNGGTGSNGGANVAGAYAGGNGAKTFYTGCTASVTCNWSSNAAATAGVTYGSGGGGGAYNGTSATNGVATGSTSTAGGAGVGGVVIFSWTISNGAVSSITFSGSIKKLAPVVITANVSNTGKVNFFANGRPIPRCQGISTTGSSPNITAVCNWKPITHGSQYVSATVYSATGAFTTGSNYSATASSKRTTAR